MEIPEDDFATGAALLQNGDVYVSVQYHTNPRTEVLHTFKLDKQSGRWSIVDQSPDTHDILGIDGDQVVSTSDWDLALHGQVTPGSVLRLLNISIR